jgi:hypothetical protein
MQRLKDYLNFMAWFAGLGYGLLRPFAQSVELPTVLHAIGLTALAFVLAQLVLRFLQRAVAKAVPVGDPAKPAARSRPPQLLPRVKPRTQFGLRGARR